MRYLIAALALAGVVVSALALHVHYVTGVQPCDFNSHWDCGIVNHSSFAVMAHVPVALIGIIGYLVIAALAFIRQRFWLVIAVFAGFCFALRLSFIEEYALEVWCLYCVISQTIISLLLLLSLGWLGKDYYRLKGGRRAA
jgi:vitamin-K-epoxide reductase (warfarin-sensitive)